jgi:hypothetical protein
MKIGLKQVSAVLMIVGSVLFVVGANLPISSRVFPEPSAVKRLESITDAPGEWLVAQVLFALGAIVTVIGIALLAYHVRDQTFAVLMWASTVVLALGAVLWVWEVVSRAADPAAFAEGSMLARPQFLSFVLTEAGLAIFGVALLYSTFPAWAAWVVVVSMVLMLILTLVLGDTVPLFLYVVTLLVGVVLLTQRRALERRRS